VENCLITRKIIYRTLDLINEVLNLNTKVKDQKSVGGKFTKDFCRLFSSTKFLTYLSKLFINWNLNEKDQEYLNYHYKILGK
jgi:hypothetical protein